MQVEYTVIDMPPPFGTLRLAASQQGLCRIALGDEPIEEFGKWLEGKVGHPVYNPAAPLLKLATGQVSAYLEGSLREFDLPLDKRGTQFQAAVWQAVMSVPYDHTSTYGQLAAQIGRPQASRAVGAANGVMVPTRCR